MEVFQDDKYGGAKDTYIKSTAQVNRDNGATSFKLTVGCCVQVYDEANFRGRSTMFCQNTDICEDRHLCDLWNDKISSFKLFQKGR